MRGKARTTLKDVAAAAGVGISTASYVLNKTGLHKVGPETRDRIIAAARRIKYRPSYTARSLRNGKTFLIGTIIPSISYSFMPEILQGIEDVLGEYSYNTILCSYHTPEEFAERCAILAQKQVDGVLARPSDPASLARLEEYFLDTLPCVMVATPSGRLPGVCVGPELVGRLGGEYLAGKGHRRIISYGWPATDPRSRGLADYFTGKGARVHYISAHDVGVDELLDRHVLAARIQPTAVFCDGVNAPRVLVAARARGVRVPGDLSILGTDGYAYDAYTDPPMSSILQPRYEQGAIAARQLMEWIAQPDRRPAGLVLAPTLRERGSVADAGGA